MKKMKKRVKKILVFGVIFLILLAIILILNNIYANIYTKTEVDALLAQKVTGQNVLDMLDKNCVIYSVSHPNSSREVTGDEICAERNAGTCILTIHYDDLDINSLIQRCTPYASGWSDKTVAYCCTS